MCIAVYACVRIISETIASLPLHFYRYTEEGKEKDYIHPLYRILHDEPNPEMTAFVFRETIVSHLLLQDKKGVFFLSDFLLFRLKIEPYFFSLNRYGFVDFTPYKPFGKNS